MNSDHAAPAAAVTQAKKDRHMVSWTQEEDDLLRNQVAVHGCDNWTIIAAQFKNKTGRQCRRRWLTYLNTECKKGGWSQEEDMLLCEAQKIFGNRWTEIAKVVKGRTDNAVKNRFSTLCRKRAKHHTISKENNDSYILPSKKKIMLEPSANKQHFGCGSSDQAEASSSYERLATDHGISGAESRPPLAVLTQNFKNLSCFPAQCHPDSSIKPTSCDNCEVQRNFLRRDDPKLTALLQQAELLSTLAVKACSENKSKSLEDAWKELQSFLIRTQEGGTLSTFSGMDFLLDNFEAVFKDFQCADTEIQLLTRDGDLEDSQASSEMTTGCTQDDPGNNMDKHQLEHCSTGCNAGHSHQHEAIPAPLKFVCQGEAMSSFLELAQNGEKLPVSSNSEFDSPLKTIPPFHSFTEEIPSPEFSFSERKFLLSVLGTPSPIPVSNTNQTPCKRDPQPHSDQTHSCKRVLLDSL
ncbi:transcription factor MYB124-like isoform X2 [Phalaenopsis equestris]|uniref:transcription factor MYB124-like isoform X2 n=1 Tax=Phalaenopsis equestris TaxID=78828 RepID=UPI0009E47174|nr:transcription factor MYB124-like isoform X2 [Phalaenopsis equestris]